MPTGIYEHQSRPVEDRFWEKVEKDGANGCWLWQGAVTRTGYGQFGWNGRTAMAHRVAYTLFVGPIPEDLELDHLWRTRGCVNPVHLEAVTHRTNLLRGNTIVAHFSRQTHCLRGHEFTEVNTIANGPGRRKCRICKNKAHQAYKRRKRGQNAGS